MSPLLFNIYIDDKIFSNVNRNVFIIAYADDILLLTPFVTALRNLFRHCKVQLNYLDMSITPRKYAVSESVLDVQ